ncbi:hypothetical protein E2C01_087223 [Portunus trituberculatus]|uniref:Uncharacterized protein n=1 Tax=Portunus trituberculatus TaxID=210409 RepID=A0A5B7J2R9_PORTR|nr:hypothetical protein [Portunus trituberculatus]
METLESSDGDSVIDQSVLNIFRNDLARQAMTDRVSHGRHTDARHYVCASAFICACAWLNLDRCLADFYRASQTVFCHRFRHSSSCSTAGWCLVPFVRV